MQSSTMAAPAASNATDGARIARRQSLLAAGLAAFFGALILWLVGFSPIEAVHDAAHDVRHSSGFPCH